MCIIVSRGWEWCLQSFDPPKLHLIPQMDLEDFRPQISKLGPIAKMGLASQFLQFFHPKSDKIDEKLYNYPIRIIPLLLGRILVPKIFY
jgi:hypothetical protein